MLARRLIMAAALFLLAAAAHAASVLFIATPNVPVGKFRLLEGIARTHGVQAEVRYLDKIPADADATLFKGYDAVFFDTYLQDAVRGRLARALPGLKKPQLWLYDAQPAWSGLPDPLAKRLLAYYVNGGRANFDGFFRTLAAQLAGRAATGVAEPLVFPKLGIYHPLAPQIVFADTPSYFAWKGVDPRKRPPTVAIALHQQYIASEQLAFINDLIARIEAAGAVALPFYGPAMESPAPLISVQGRAQADVIINTQIILNPEGRRREFEAFGIPVVQATPYRKGDAAAWAADPQGVNLSDVPFYLAQGEYAGIVDAMVASATSDEQIVAIPEQAQAVVEKALKLVRLQRLENAEKRLAVFFWNYPPGEKNLSASYLNLPKSLAATLEALRGAGYRTQAHEEPVLTALLQRLLAPFYRDGELEPLLRDGLAELLPVADYRAWLGRQPAAVQQAMLARWGEPERSSMVVRRDGVAYFVVPRAKFGNVVLLPQPPRGEKWEGKEKQLYHSVKAGPSHFYLAAYLWARQGHRADALIHYGTHGSQEWLPGKERGLSVSDYPLLAVGDVPVVYPYIVDNIGEALQAKRRGRAVTITHQTPPFAPAGLHEALTRMHDLLHAWIGQDSGAVKERLAADLLRAARAERVERDMGWDEARIAAAFPAFVEALHNHLHELAQTAQPLGLHTFGTAPAQQHRLGTVLLMLGRRFWELAAAPGEEADESFVGDYQKLSATTAYQLLKRYALDGAPLSEVARPELAAMLEQGRAHYAALSAGNEMAALLAALSGRHIPTSYGGDPIRNPEALPTGRNLYGFDPSRVPTQQAWAAGKEALEALLATHRKAKGRLPKKLAFSLWSVETMRHQGILEAQALWALGVEPVWDAGGRVVDVKLVPRAALGRPRVDVVLSVTGLYRDHFPNAMRQLARAAQLAAEAQEDDNPVAANTRDIAARLERAGMAPAERLAAAQTRMFSSESGRYGTGLDGATLASDSWKGKDDGDRKLADLYLSRMQFAYGPDQSTWGQAGAKVNLYAEALRGTEGAVLSRSSNLYGMLTTDDPFQYLGGLSLAVRRLDGKAPELYISNLREAGAGGAGGKVESAAGFLAKELATRNFHPGYIKGLMAEGYAGTLQVLDSVNNFWGWQAVAREVVRDDQWQEFVDVYVRDKHRLGVKDWFERDNPHALAQSIERMLEAARKGYWKADADTVRELKQRWREISARHDVKSDNAQFKAFVAAGFGTGAARPSPAQAQAVRRPAAAGAAAAAPPAPPPIRGMQLASVAQTPPPRPGWPLGVLALLGAILAGAVRQTRAPGAPPDSRLNLR
ncbi:cobaltochelatase subunit CobN [Janthinobacterium fluminis]|uniref:Cobaltochelatase subunit CobN n=1 Tax=Janthinobacterium fluminis TaxID=2987524 RepID=A0ABT5K003_9BURK|nr:cobaltochelatase subunit CobN [Janthinobacterium fluminis]MDC8758302.1 cobaltochelatase subunit CobN [Janthinobacterium fluminis]